VGVKFDEPLGHNDGTVKGTRIFECEDGYGAFVRGNKVLTGDYPERDLFADDDDEEDKEDMEDEEEATAEDEDEI
jgi:tubulin-folding cofactor B